MCKCICTKLLKRGIKKGDYIGDYIGVMKGDTGSLDFSSSRYMYIYIYGSICS